MGIQENVFTVERYSGTGEQVQRVPGVPCLSALKRHWDHALNNILKQLVSCAAVRQLLLMIFEGPI